MKPAAFTYHAPATVGEVLEILGAHGDEAKPLAGGQSLVPMLSMRLARFAHIVDLNRVAGLDEITAGPGGARIGPMVRQVAIERSEVVARRATLLAMATPHIGHLATRTRGTLGGSVAHADPVAEYPTVATALDAELELASAARGVRRVPASAFFEGTFSTVVADDELLVGLELPAWPAASGFSFLEVARRHGDFALVATAAGIALDGSGAIVRAAVALAGMGSVPLRAAGAEQALVGTPLAALDPVSVGRLAVQGARPSDDVHASGDYRRRVCATLVARALEQAAQRATAALRAGEQDPGDRHEREQEQR